VTWSKRDGSWLLLDEQGVRLDSLTYDAATQHYRDASGAQLSRNFNDACQSAESKAKQSKRKRRR
jgi:hypothetical protein